MKNFDYQSFQNRLASIANIFDRELALLEDTASFYNRNNRAVLNDGRCVYAATETSPGCAIGRCLDRNNVPPNYSDINVYALWDNKTPHLPAWLHEMNVDFLRNLQAFHDCERYWDASGLTPLGREMFEWIKENINFRRAAAETP